MAPPGGKFRTITNVAKKKIQKLDEEEAEEEGIRKVKMEKGVKIFKQHIMKMVKEM